MGKQVLYRLEVNYYSQDYDDKALETSSPIFALSEGVQRYLEAIQEKCEDDPEKPAKARRRAARAAKKDELPNSAVWPAPKSKRRK